MKNTELFELLGDVDDKTVDSVPAKLEIRKRNGPRFAVIAVAAALAVAAAGILAWSVAKGAPGAPSDPAVGAETGTAAHSETEKREPLPGADGAAPRVWQDKGAAGSYITFPLRPGSFYTSIESIPDELRLCDEDIPDTLPVFKQTVGTGQGGLMRRLTDEELESNRALVYDVIAGVFGEETAETVEITKDTTADAYPAYFGTFDDGTGQTVTVRATSYSLGSAIITIGNTKAVINGGSAGLSEENEIDPDDPERSVRENPTVQRALAYLGINSPVYLTETLVASATDPGDRYVEPSCSVFDGSGGPFTLEGGYARITVDQIRAEKLYPLHICIRTPRTESAEYFKAFSLADAREALKEYLGDGADICDVDGAIAVPAFVNDYWEYGSDYTGDRDGEAFLVPVYRFYVEGKGDLAGRYISVDVTATSFDAGERNPYGP